MGIFRKIVTSLLRRAKQDKQKDIRFAVYDYFEKNRKKYDKGQWIDVIADYCKDNYIKDKDEVFRSFDLEFVVSEIGQLSLQF